MITNTTKLLTIICLVAGCQTTTSPSETANKPAAVSEAPKTVAGKSGAYDEVLKFRIHQKVASLYVKYCAKSEGVRFARTPKAEVSQAQKNIVKQGYAESDVTDAFLDTLSSKGIDDVGQGTADYINSLDKKDLKGSGAPICNAAKAEIKQQTPVGKMLKVS